MRSQVKQLEDDQKRRAKRSVTDSLDRTLTDLLSFYRDVLIIQLGNAVELVNVELRSELEDFAATVHRRSDPCPHGRHQQGPQTDHHHQRRPAAGHRVHGRQPDLTAAAPDRSLRSSKENRMKPARPCPQDPDPGRRLRAAGAMALALRLASCSLLLAAATAARKAPATGQADPVDRRLRRPPSSAASTPSRSTGRRAKTSFECAKIKVPLDYSKPDGGTIEIAALKLATNGNKKGSLLVNPGGPGGSGYDFVRDAGHHAHFRERPGELRSRGLRPARREALRPGHLPDRPGTDAARAKIYDLDTDAGLAERPGGQQGHRRQMRREDRRRSWPTSTPSAPPRTWTSCAACSTTRS